MKVWSTCLVTMALSAASLPAAAQEHGGMQPPPGGGRAEASMHAQPCMDMMSQPNPAMLLRMKDALGLSAAQVTQLQQVQQQGSSAMQEHMREAMQAHERGRQLLRADAPDMTAVETTAKQAAEHMALAHVAMIRAGVDARKVLTADQRQKLQTGMAMMRAMMRPMMMDSAGARHRPGMMGERGEGQGEMRRMRVEITRGPGMMGETSMMTMMGGMDMMHCMPMAGMMSHP